MKQFKAVLIGAGLRGVIYTNEMKKCEEMFKVVGVAEPLANRRNYIKETHGLSEDACFEKWEDLLLQPKVADIAIIATMDEMHYEPAMKAIELGYHVLLEKPVAPTVQECVDIYKAAQKHNVKVLVCHVLRYTHFYKSIKQLLLDGAIGDVMSLVEVEAVGNTHQSHSFVRGNWHKESETAPMIIAKSCHDIDIIQWLMNEPCEKVQSFGRLTYFTEKNAPKGAPARCIEGCPIENNCPYNAKMLYFDNKDNSWFRGACTKGIAKGAVPTDDEVMESLKTTDYGLCVFKAHNDVVDHQTVNMQFKSGASATLLMNAFNEGGRYIRIFGTKGELYGNMEDSQITLFTFADRKTTTVTTSQIAGETHASGHGGGDAGIIKELYEYLDGSYNGYCAADIGVSVKNHMIGFAAEVSRHSNSVESLDEYFEKYGVANEY